MWELAENKQTPKNKFIFEQEVRYMTKYSPVAIALLCVCNSGIAAADVYTTIGGYYSKVEKPVDRAGSAVQFGIGYQLSGNWSV